MTQRHPQRRHWSHAALLIALLGAACDDSSDARDDVDSTPGEDAGPTTTGEPEPSAEGSPSSSPDDPEEVGNPGEPEPDSEPPPTPAGSTDPVDPVESAEPIVPGDPEPSVEPQAEGGVGEPSGPRVTPPPRPEDAGSDDGGPDELDTAIVETENSLALAALCVFDEPAAKPERVAACAECPDDPTECRIELGVASVDAYFRAVAELAREAEFIEQGVQRWIEQAARFARVETGGPDETLANLAAVAASGYLGTIEGALDVQLGHASCVADTSAMVERTAQCDSSIDPNRSPECEGTCISDAAERVECSGAAELRCSGQTSTCAGSCSGTCAIESGTCEGQCLGECELDGSVPCPGTCEGTLNAVGWCQGICTTFGGGCPGSCRGECFLPAGGTCDGGCEDSCTFVPPDGGCPSDTSFSCVGNGEAVECSGSCDGQLSVPETAAECEALATLFGAQVSTCTVPLVFAVYSLGAQAGADFEADLEAGVKFDRRVQCYAATVAQASALGARAETLLRDSEGLVQAHDVFVAVVDNVPSARDTCAAARLDTVPVALEIIFENLATSAQRVAELQAATR